MCVNVPSPDGLGTHLVPVCETVRLRGIGGCWALGLLGSEAERLRGLEALPVLLGLPGQRSVMLLRPAAHSALQQGGSRSLSHGD